MYARSPTEAGFTIVETMIFLAISGLMFVLAVNAMSGKQQETEFQTSVDILKSELSSTLSNVSNGNYPTEYNDQTYECIGSNPTGPAISLSTNPPDGSCTAIGQIIAFGPDNSSGGQQYYTVPVFGCTYSDCSAGNNLSTNLNGAMSYIDPTDGIYTTSSMPFGLTIDNSNSSYQAPGAFGIFSFTNDSGEGLGLSGASHLEIFAIPDFPYITPPNRLATSTLGSDVSGSNGLDGTCYTGSLTDVCTGAHSHIYTETINPSSGITFCVDSGTSASYSAVFTIGGVASSGGSGNVASVTDQIFNNAGC